MLPAIEMDEMRLQTKELIRLYREEFEEAQEEGRESVVLREELDEEEI